MLTCKNCRNFSPKKGMCTVDGSAKTEETQICKDFAVFPIERELDGVYFRVRRNGEWNNICFSDMTHDERKEVIGSRTTEWWMALAGIMADTLREVGDKFDITRVAPEEE